ncbi:unnamed protein product [Lepidochelys kempii]
MAGLKGREGEPSPFHLLSLPYSTMSFGLQGSKAFILLTSASASLGGAQGSWSKDESLTGRKRRGKESGWVGLMPHLSENERGVSALDQDPIVLGAVQTQNKMTVPVIKCLQPRSL